MSDNPKLTTSQQVLYSSKRVQGMIDSYYIHTYQILLLGAPTENNYRVIFTNGIKYKWSNGFMASWSHEQAFATLEEAKKRYKEIEANPFETAKQLIGADNYWVSQFTDKNRRKDYKTETDYARPKNFEAAKMLEDILKGKEKLPIEYHATEVVPLLWENRQNKNARTELAAFISKTESLLYGFWGAWKWLYKQAEQTNDTELITVFLKRLDNLTFGKSNSNPVNINSPDWFERGPSPKTIGYMKRRGRRFLKNLAKTQPQQYIQVAVEILKHNLEAKVNLNPTINWISLDILFGRSGRMVQRGHGRGEYKIGRKRVPVSYTDPHNDLWAAHPKLLQDFYQSKSATWLLAEWALIMLRHNKIAVPEISFERAEQFITLQSPILVREGMLKLLSKPQVLRDKITAQNLAYVFWYANATQRQVLTQVLTQKEAIKDKTWGSAFAKQLYVLFFGRHNKYRFSRRSLEAAHLLANYYADRLDQWQRRQLLPFLMIGLEKNPQIVELIAKIVSEFSAWDVFSIVPEFENTPEPGREQLLQLLIKRLEGQTISSWYANNLVTNRNSEWIRLAGWRLFDVLKDKDEDGILDAVLNRHSPEVINSALMSPIGFKLFTAHPEKMQALKEAVLNQPEFLTNLDWKVLNTLLKALPLDFVLSLIGITSEERWPELRTQLLAELELDGRVGALWQIAWQQAATMPNLPNLLPRLLNDTVLKKTFFDHVSQDYFKNVPPEFITLLLEWLANAPEVFKLGSSELLLAASSKILEIRTAALRRVTEVGQTLPFALRLLESGLPEVIAKGKEFFDGLPSGDSRELDYALAICDSPDKIAQLYGREYLQKRWQTLPTAELLRRLSEHPDPIIQEMLADRLLQTPELRSEVPTTEFDRAVLRRRNKGRRVKEMVKERVGQQTPDGLDKATLLEMARSRTKQDAEWALQQLVRLAEAGEQVEGFKIEGVNGI